MSSLKLASASNKDYCRSEHWMVVIGLPKLQTETRFLLSRKTGPPKPLGEAHRLANLGIIPGDIIEVQLDTCLGEDDVSSPICITEN